MSPMSNLEDVRPGTVFRWRGAGSNEIVRYVLAIVPTRHTHGHGHAVTMVYLIRIGNQLTVESSVFTPKLFAQFYEVLHDE